MPKIAEKATHPFRRTYGELLLRILVRSHQFFTINVVKQYLNFLLRGLNSSLDFVNSEFQKGLLCLVIVFKGKYFFDASSRRF